MNKAFFRTISLSIFVSIFFMSCSKDKDGGSGIEGRWNLERRDVTFTFTSLPPSKDEELFDRGEFYFEFKSDGTLGGDYLGDPIAGRWQLVEDGTKLQIMETGGSSLPYGTSRPYTIEKHEGGELILSDKVQTGAGTYTEQRYTFKR